MCSSENELIHDVRQVHLEELIMNNEEQFVMVRFPLTDEQVDAFCDSAETEMEVSDDNRKAVDAAIRTISTPIPPCEDVETVDLSEYMPEYHDQGMGCGLEDRGITDRYEAMGYGWDQALERVCSELPEMVRRTDMEAQVARVAAEKDAEIVRLRDALFGIDVYAGDTLSGPAVGPIHEKWLKVGVQEIRHRARAALNEGAAE